MLLLACAFTCNAQVADFNTTAFCVRGTDTEWSKWYPSKLTVHWSFKGNQIVINSSKTQVLNYGSIYEESTPEFYYYTAVGIDQDKVTMRFELYSYKKTGWFFLKICYANAEYKYKMYLRKD